MSHKHITIWGIALMTLAMQIVPFSDAAAKILTAQHGLGTLQTAWGRIAFSALFLLPLGGAALRLGKGWGGVWRAAKPHWLRGACWVGATVAFFVAIKDNPLPSALALLFVAPLFITATAPLLLGESFSALRLAAVATGFCGVLLVLRPDGESFSPSLAVALLSGVCYGGYIMATRHAHMAAAPSGHIAFMTMAAATCLLTPFVFFSWQSPTPAQWGLMAGMGALSALGHFCIAQACQYAEASRLAPFTYTEIIGMTAVSWLFFAELPAASAFAGIALIVAAGVFVSMLDWHKNK